MQVNRTHQRSCGETYRSYGQIKSNISDMQRNLYQAKKGLYSEAKQLSRLGFNVIKDIISKSEEWPDCVRNLCKYVHAIYLCNRCIQGIIRPTEKLAGKSFDQCDADELLPILIKGWVSQGKYNEILTFLESIPEHNKRFNLFRFVVYDFLKAQKFDEVLAFTNRQAVDGSSEILTSQTFCRQLAQKEDYLIAWRLAQSRTDSIEKSDVIHIAISESLERFLYFPSDKEEEFALFLIEVIRDGHLKECRAWVEKELSNPLDIKNSYIAIENALIECGMYSEVVSCGDFANYQELSAALLRKRKYNHAIRALACISDKEERFRQLTELSEKFYAFGMDELSEEAIKASKIIGGDY